MKTAKNPRPIFNTPTTEKKIIEIVQYSAKKWGEKTAREYSAQIEKVIESVAAGKTRTKKRSEFSTRFSYCTARRHYIFFEFQENKLIVATIFHTAMHVKERMRVEMPTIEREIDKIT